VALRAAKSARTGLRPARSRAGALRAHLRRHGLVAYATRASFGLGCDPRDVRALRRLLALKRRPKSKGLIVIAAGWQALQPFAQPPGAEILARAAEGWPGPRTWLFDVAARVPGELRGRHRKIALRVDAHPDAVALCRSLGMALVSTSANRAGRRPIRTSREILRQFGTSVALVPGRTERRARPSTIADPASGRLIRR